MASPDVAFRLCQYCGEESSRTRRIRACTRCFSVGYCSKACQKADWSGRDGHKSRCRPRSSPKDDSAVRLEVKRADGNGAGEHSWEDVGPINILQDTAASMILPNNKIGGGVRLSSAPKKAVTRPKLGKDLPIAMQRILGPEPSDKYKYRHSPDGIDENLMIFFHGAGDSHLPYDASGIRMELPQTATLSLSASMFLKLTGGNESNHLSKFVELPFGLGYTWFEEMDYSTGETLQKDHPRRIKSLSHAVHLLDLLLCSVTEIGCRGSNAHGASWIPERIFLFGFSAGGCLIMELCRVWMNAGRMPLGGAICISGGIRTKQKLPCRVIGPMQQTVKIQPTEILIITGTEDSAYPKESAILSKQFYHSQSVHVHVQKGKGHSMIGSEDEMKVVMEFLSKKLVRRMVSMEGHFR